MCLLVFAPSRVHQGTLSLLVIDIRSCLGGNVGQDQCRFEGPVNVPLFGAPALWVRECTFLFDIAAL